MCHIIILLGKMPGVQVIIWTNIRVKPRSQGCYICMGKVLGSQVRREYELCPAKTPHEGNSGCHTKRIIVQLVKGSTALKYWKMSSWIAQFPIFQSCRPLWLRAWSSFTAMARQIIITHNFRYNWLHKTCTNAARYSARTNFTHQVCRFYVDTFTVEATI